MTTGALIASSAAAAANARRLGGVLDAFRLADATAPDRARPLQALGLTQTPEVIALARQRVLVHDMSTDGWYLSEAAYIAQRDVQPKRAVRLLLLFIAITLALVTIGMIALIRTRPVAVPMTVVPVAPTPPTPPVGPVAPTTP